MNDLAAYRDDGPLATQLGKLTDGSTIPSAPLVTLVGLAVLAAGLSTLGTGVGVPVLAASVVGCVLLAGTAAGQELTGRFDWLVPAMLRAGEYGALLVLALVAEPTTPSALPACFVLVAVLVYNHYNITYRLRYQDAAVPRWLRYAGGGWDVRLLVTFGLFAAGWLPIGMYVVAGVLAVLHVGETVFSWRRAVHAHAAVVDEEEEDETE